MIGFGEWRPEIRAAEGKEKVCLVEIGLVEPAVLEVLDRLL